MREQPALALDPATIVDQRTIGADQAMAGNHDAERVRTVGMADHQHRRADRRLQPIERKCLRPLRAHVRAFGFFRMTLRARDLPPTDAAPRRRATAASAPRATTIRPATDAYHRPQPWRAASRCRRREMRRAPAARAWRCIARSIRRSQAATAIWRWLLPGSRHG